MGRYIAVPIARDPIEVEEQSIEVVKSSFPTWEARDADPMTVVLRSVAVLYADVAELVTRMGEEAFRYFGRGIANLPPNDELSAVGSITVTAQDTDGPYLVPEGLEVTGRSPLGEPVAFRTVAAAVIPNGATTVSVAVEAIEEGAAGNSIDGVAEFSEYVDYLTEAEFDALTTGGRDREADPEYLERLSEELELMSPRPILPENFAVLARRYGAHRATAIDGLNPTHDTTGNTATVAVAMIDEAGNPVPGVLRTAIETTLENMREVGFSVYGFDPAYATIDVAFTATAYPGADLATVQAAAIEALTSYLSPARWGQREDTGETREWLNEPVVRHLELAERLQRIEGLRFVDTLTLAEAGDALATADVTMVGYAPLPLPGSITGTVSAG